MIITLASLFKEGRPWELWGITHLGKSLFFDPYLSAFLILKREDIHIFSAPVLLGFEWGGMKHFKQQRERKVINESLSGIKSVL